MQRAFEIGHQFLGWGWGSQPCLRPRIPARAHFALCPIHSVNQTAINIANTDAQFTLAKEMILWVGCGKPCQVQNPDIDGGNGDIGGIARLDPIDLDRNRQGPARGNLGGHLNRRGQRPRAGINCGVGQAQRARRVAPCRHIHRPQDGSGNIDARAPFIGHGQRDQVFALRHLNRLHCDQPVRQNGDQRGSGRTRHNPQHRGIAGLIGGLV